MLRRRVRKRTQCCLSVTTLRIWPGEGWRSTECLLVGLIRPVRTVRADATKLSEFRLVEVHM